MSLIALFLSFFGAVVSVTDQASFDRLQERVDSVLRTPVEEVSVEFAPGVYYYREGQLRFCGLDRPDVTVRLSGSGAVLVAGDDGGGYDLETGYVDTDALEAVDVRDTVRKARSWPVPILGKKGLYKIRCREPDCPSDAAKGMQIILSQWFKGAVYPVEKIHRGWLYFRRERDYGVGMWTELRFGRCLPRYILCKPPRREGLHPCRFTNFLTVQECVFRSLWVEGFHFLGNREGGSLLFLEGLKASSVRLSGCRFTGLHSDGIVVKDTDGVEIRDCLFQGNYLGCIRIEGSSREADVHHNRFIDNGLKMTNAPLVQSMGVDCRIRDNYFEDFSYSAIGVGLHFTVDDSYGTSTLVENNEICMSESFRNGVFRELVDAGAIYIWTQNQGTVVRGNYIHDLAGPHGNRGILADDGVVHVELSGNRVFRIQDGHCIDLRKCFRIQRRKASKVRRANVGNRIFNNLVDGRVRVFVRRDDPESYIGGNRRVKSEQCVSP